MQTTGSYTECHIATIRGRQRKHGLIS